MKRKLTKKEFMRLMFAQISLVLALIGASVSAQAQGVQCKALFPKAYDGLEFVISAAKKGNSAVYVEAAYHNLLDNNDPGALFQIVQKIATEGLDGLTKQEKKSIIKFRQDSSFLRSVIQSATKEHESPPDFAKFVRDLGTLKDLIVMANSEEAKAMAQKIIRKHDDLDFTTLLSRVTPASKKSVRDYFKGLLKDTKKIMARPIVTVDDVHDVRKNLRDILRYMQTQQEIRNYEQQKAELDFTQSERTHDSVEIAFLKKTNLKLGEICDAYAAQILNNSMTKNSLVQFPEKIRDRIEYFLTHYQLEIEN